MSSTQQCAGCLNHFEPRRFDQRWCSEKCKWRARRMTPMTDKPCGACGAAFSPRRRAQRWCSRKCKDVGLGAAFRASGRRANLSPAAAERQRLSWQAKNRRRRAAKKGGASEPYTLAEIAERDGRSCGLCGAPVPMDAKVPDLLAPTIDHIVPIALGGDDTCGNVQLAHFRCNSVKGARGIDRVAPMG